MNAVLTFVSLVVCAVIVIAVPSQVTPYVAEYGVVTVFDTGKAVLLCTALATLVGLFSYRQAANGPFLFKLFISALLVRMILGTIIFTSNGQVFFGGDALAYDFFGIAQLHGWSGDRYAQSVADIFVKSWSGAGWGMVYLVAGVYGIVGRNMLAVQFVNSVLGAATAVMIFLCAHHVYNNLRVARLAGIAVAFYPSLVLWSSQGLKDGAIVFFLALSMLATLRLGEKLTIKYIAVLLCSLLAVLSLRFYVFYMMCFAAAGTFVIGTRTLTTTSFFRQFIIIAVLGLALTYLGITRSGSIQFERFGNLAEVQRVRDDSAHSAESGFGRDVDVSTTAGALSAIPMGLVYLLFAPFPWQLVSVSLRQSLTLPEMIIWWASFPMLVLGLWFSIRYRLRMISPILSFTLMLSLAYSVFQGNVGTAYRQRAQLLVFYFIFVAVGYVLLLERREEKKRAIVAEKQSVAAASVASTLARSRDLNQ